MKTTSWLRQLQFAKLRQVFWNLGLISVGSVLCAVAINGILIPHKFVSGGFTGLALVIYYLLPAVPVAWVYFFLNVPLFVLGWKYVSRRFFIYSIAGMIIFSCALKWVNASLPVQDQILSALLAGIISGAGAGVILRSVGSAGGLDILSVMVLQRFSVRLGTTSLAFNSLVLAAAAMLLSLERALYTLVYIYVSSYMLNLVVTGLSQRKAVFIISARWQEISQEIFEKLDRGLTVIKGQGGYSGQEEQILYTVITFRELSRIKGIIRRLDPSAFVVVTETLEVMGQGIGNQPHW
ncbi:MAG: YitT family protein [Deltaproteobacteria bacterium]|nr:YitT family protein [Deltaproteobacteria bacterium]